MRAVGQGDVGTTVALWTIDQKSIEHDGIRNGIELLAQLLSSPTIGVSRYVDRSVSRNQHRDIYAACQHAWRRHRSDSCSRPAPDDQARAVLSGSWNP